MAAKTTKNTAKKATSKSAQAKAAAKASVEASGAPLSVLSEVTKAFDGSSATSLERAIAQTLAVNLDATAFGQGQGVASSAKQLMDLVKTVDERGSDKQTDALDELAKRRLERKRAVSAS